MGKASPALAAFNAGEFSPQMEGRVDAEKYAIATHIQQNFISLKQGPSTFRPGTVNVQQVKNSANRCWLVRFEYSQTQAFQIEFGDKYVRFYTLHGPLLTTGNAAYSNATAYVVGNQVVSGGVTYYCIASTTGNAPPNATCWYAMAAYNGSATTAIYEIPSPYAAADLTDSLGEFSLQIQQSGDVLYIAGGAAGVGYRPYTLTRYANNPPNWQFALYAPTDGPFSSAVPLVPGSEIALTVSAVNGNGITITAYGGNLFAATDVGRLVRIQSQVYNTTPWSTNVAWVANNQCSNGGHNYTALANGTSGASPPVHTAGTVADGTNVGTNINWLYTDSGYGVAQITSYVSPTQVTANVLLQFPRNVVGAPSTITAITQASPAVVTAANSLSLGQAVFLTGVAGMTQVNQIPMTAQSVSGSTVTLAGINSTAYPAYSSGGTLVGNASVEWQLGAWSNTTEWPRACAFFKDRLFWAGKLNVWGSVPGYYNSHAPDQFGQQITASAMNDLVTGSDASSICWLSAAVVLLIGTEGGEYGLDAANYSTSPLGPANVEILRQSNWRCRHIAPQFVGTTVLYMQRAGRKLFAADYNFYLNRYDSTDQSKYAYHITIGGVTSIAYQQEPWSILWAIRADGTLLSYTFNREDNVTAWCRHNMGGGGVVESISVTPAPDGLRDELWMIVKRTVNGQTIRTVEYMAKHYEGPQGGYAGDPQSSAWYVDCGVQQVATPAPGATSTTVTGIPAVLWNQTVGILADGGIQPQGVVSSSGTLTVQGAFTTVTLGFPYQGNLVPMRPEGGADIGTAQGKKKQGATLVVRLVDSAGGIVSQLKSSQNAQGSTLITATNTENIRLNDTSTGLDMPPPIQSGDYPVSFPHDEQSDQDASDFYILVQQNDPAPMTVAGLFPSYKVEEYQ
ncbi:MAG: hypothetical protein M3O06_12205 [Pseudomonadota bacterium]|nr:hypothetical protein [Pseudomonadota bacterium]